MPTAKVTDPPPANSHIIEEKMLMRQIMETTTTPKSTGMLVFNSDTLFDQKSPVHQEAGFPRWHTQTHTRLMDIATYRLNRARGPIQ